MREAFKDLLKGWARSHDLVFVPEYEYETATRNRRYVDGPLRYSLRVPFGYWEAKDQKDDLYAEIEIKRRRGHPRDNIIFEDSREAVLIQNRQEVVRCPGNDTSGLEKLLKVIGIPREAWDYKLGNRCALEWVLDPYKEKAPRDPTTREKFNTYRFADYKEKVVDLLRRVTTVSVETQRIVEAMKVAAR